MSGERFTICVQKQTGKPQKIFNVILSKKGTLDYARLNTPLSIFWKII